MRYLGVSCSSAQTAREPPNPPIPLLVSLRSAQSASPQSLPRSGCCPQTRDCSLLNTQKKPRLFFSPSPPAGPLPSHSSSPQSTTTNLHLLAFACLSRRLTRPSIAQSPRRPAVWTWLDTLDPTALPLLQSAQPVLTAKT